MKLVYVAGPISKGDLVANICRAHEVGIALLKMGASVIVPHGSCFWGSRVRLTSREELGFVPQVLPSGTVHKDWYEIDLEIVKRCDAVYRIYGESTGADLEVQHARANQIPVFFFLDHIKQWLKE